jgi:transcriptional regulator with XRE-family HTH domain
MGMSHSLISRVERGEISPWPSFFEKATSVLGLLPPAVPYEEWELNIPPLAVDPDEEQNHHGPEQDTREYPLDLRRPE